MPSGYLPRLWNSKLFATTGKCLWEGAYSSAPMLNANDKFRMIIWLRIQFRFKVSIYVDHTLAETFRWRVSRVSSRNCRESFSQTRFFRLDSFENLLSYRTCQFSKECSWHLLGVFHRNSHTAMVTAVCRRVPKESLPVFKTNDQRNFWIFKSFSSQLKRSV